MGHSKSAYKTSALQNLISDRYERITRPFCIAERWAAVFVMCGMVILPVAGALTRKLFNFPLQGAVEYLQHGTLWIAFIGASLAAIENEHLKLSTGVELIKGRPGKLIYGFGTSVTIAVIAAFVMASMRLIFIERETGSRIAGLLPVWIAQLIMPVFLTVAAIRLLNLNKGHYAGKVSILLMSCLLLSMVFIPVDSRGMLFWPGLGILFIATALGAPLFVLLAGVGLFLFYLKGEPVSIIPAEAYRIVSSPTLPTIPLFTLAGYVLSEGKSSRRLVRLFRALFGWMPGGIAITTVLVFAFFATFTGASGVTILALGGLLFPILLKEKYPEKFSLGLITASGSIGLLFPPALPIILYGIQAGIPIDRLFVAGVTPGIMLVAVSSLYGLYVFKKTGIVPSCFSFKEAFAAVNEAKWDIILPVIIIVSIFSGLATLVEAAALSALYAIFIECVVHREMSFMTKLPRAVIKSAKLVGSVMIVLGFAFGFTSYLVDAEIPTSIFGWVKAHIETRLMFLIALNVFLIVVGSIIEIYSAIILVVPIIIPIAASYGIDPIHLGIVFLVNLELGFMAPPVGLNLFLSAFRFNRPLTFIYRTVWPFIVLRLFVLGAVTYIPWISLWLVR